MSSNLLTRRTFVAAAGMTVAATALGLTACTGQNTSASDASPAPARFTPHAITAALAAETIDWVPDGATTPVAISINRHVFESLYGLDPNSGRPYNALASGAPVKVSDRIFEIALRPDAKYSNGQPVHAEDVVASLAKCRATSPEYVALLSEIAAITAKDDYTLRIALRTPLENLLERRLALIKVSYGELPGQEVSDMRYNRLGSGPWMCVPETNAQAESSPTPSISFVPNPYYNGTHPALCNSMTWYALPDDNVRAKAVIDKDALAADGMQKAVTAPVVSSGATVEYVPGFGSPYIMFNCAAAPFNDVRVRQAVLYSIDYDKIIADFFAGHASVPTSSVPLTSTYYRRASTVYSRDIDRATRLLKQAGIEKLKFVLYAAPGLTTEIANRIGSDAAEAGISIEVRDGLVALVADMNTTANNAIAQFDAALHFDDPSLFGKDPDLLLTWRYGGVIWPSNEMGWTDTPEGEKLTALLKQARATSDAGEQQRLWEQAFDLIAEAVPLHPLCFCDSASAWQGEYLRGFVPLATAGFDFLDVSLR